MKFEQMKGRQRKLYTIGMSLIVIGLLIFTLSLFVQGQIFSNAEITSDGDLKELRSQLNIFYLMVIIGVSIAFVGGCLRVYTIHPYYEKKWKDENNCNSIQ